jgi:hypothetical protein
VGEAIIQLERAEHRDAAEGLRIAYALNDLKSAISASTPAQPVGQDEKGVEL